MAYIQPNSIIQLFQGINLDNRYMHTIYFSSISEQDSWFANRVTIAFQAQSYVRYTRNQVKIQCDVTSILGCSYMRFLNDRAGDKWFYAFINNVEYVNENTALVTYEIDVMQTWFFQGGSVKPCMVLREHVNDDRFGVNLEEEPIGSTEYDSDFLASFDSMFSGENNIVIQSTGRPQLAGNTVLQGLYDGTRYWTHKAEYGVDPTSSDSKTYGEVITEYLDDLLGNWDAGEQSQDVIDMYTVPSPIAEQDITSFSEFALDMTRPSTFDNYTPKNNKLFMYPFSYLFCTTHNSASSMYRWEYFDGTNIEFKGMGTPLGGGQVIAYPRAYNGQEENMDSAIAITDFPKNAFVFDAYQAWIASGGKTKVENAKEIVDMRGFASEVSALSGLITGSSNSGNLGTGLATGASNATIGGALNIAGTVLNAVSSAYNTTANYQEALNKINYEWKDARYKPNIAVGKPTPSLAMGARYLNYYFYHVHVRDDEAKRLDDFLSAYGYAVNRIKTPNLTGRQYWNFVQTKNCVIDGAMPASSKEAIGRIFDGGITFWHNGDQVGNYRQSVTNDTVNNPIV